MEQAKNSHFHNWIEESLLLLKQPSFWAPLLITLLCSYGFFVTHFAVGIDDTAMERYFVEGLAPARGRWVIFLVNKVIPLMYITPFLTDFLGVLFLAAFSVLFCGLWKLISAGRMKTWMLAIVACLIVSSPITSEVFVYYLHNGVGIGYILTLIAVFYTYECLFADGKKQALYILLSAGYLTVAIGLYESFEVAFAILAAGVLLLLMWYGKERLGWKQFWLFFIRIALVMCIAMLLRILIVNGIIALWNLEKGQTRSLYLGWLFKVGAGATIRSYLQYILLLFGLNGIFYVGVRFYVFAVLTLLIVFVAGSIRKKDGRMLLTILFITFMPWTLVVVSGNVPLYRSCQYIPVMVGMAGGVLLQLLGDRTYRLAQEVSSSVKTRLAGTLQIIVVILLGMMIYTQSFDSNRWYYLDHLKYLDDVKTCDSIYTALKAGYNLDKPVVFVGMRENPTEVTRQTQAAYDSSSYELFAWFADKWIDSSILEPYQNDEGYKYGQSAASSTLAWALSSFGDGDVELHNFMKLIGYDLVQGDVDTVRAAVQKASEVQMPAWPLEGSILETDDSIIVNIDGR